MILKVIIILLHFMYNTYRFFLIFFLKYCFPVQFYKFISFICIHLLFTDFYKSLTHGRNIKTTKFFLYLFKLKVKSVKQISQMIRMLFNKHNIVQKAIDRNVLRNKKFLVYVKQK